MLQLTKEPRVVARWSPIPDFKSDWSLEDAITKQGNLVFITKINRKNLDGIGPSALKLPWGNHSGPQNENVEVKTSRNAALVFVRKGI